MVNEGSADAVRRTALETLDDWIETHEADPAPSDDGRSWGDHVRAWRAGGASDLHVASIVAATTIWTADKSVNALVVDELIERGHDVHARDGRGRTPLAFAFAVVGEWLDSPRCGGAAIWRKRVETGLLKTMRALRNDPLVARTTSDFDAADDLGATALHHAIGLERAALGEEVVDSLVLCGADPNRPLNNGDRPIHLACRHNPSVIAALLSGDGARADPGLRDGAGSLPLELAVVGRYVGSVEGLLAGGSDPNAANGAGEPLLAVALLDQLEWGHGVIARALKDHGAIC